MGYRPITPPPGSKVKIRKDKYPQTTYGRSYPWIILTRHPHEPGFTQVSRNATWVDALRVVLTWQRQQR